eukprot:gene9102-12275_t
MMNSDKLRYYSLTPTLDEWNQVFEDTAGYGPFHLFVGCQLSYNKNLVDSYHNIVIKGYFFLENLSEGKSGVSAKSHFKSNKGNDEPSKFKMTINYFDKTWTPKTITTNGGGLFSWNMNMVGFQENSISHSLKQRNFSGNGNTNARVTRHYENINIFISDWNHFITFPLSTCVEISKNNSRTLQPKEVHRVNTTNNMIQKFVIHIYTWEQALVYDINNKNNNNIKRSLLAQAIANHFNYHKRLFSDSLYRYDVIADEEFVSFITNNNHNYNYNNTDFSDYLNNDLVRFIPKGNSPPRIKGDTPKWQNVYENIALLSSWMNQEQSTSYLFIDLDEYIIVNNHHSHNNNNNNNKFQNILRNNLQVSFYRFDTFCTNCTGNNNNNKLPEIMYNYTFHNFRRSISAHPIGKVALQSHFHHNNLDEYYCIMMVHRANPSRLCPLIRLDPNVAFILHFINLINIRQSNTDNVDISKSLPVNVSYLMSYGPSDSFQAQSQHSLIFTDHRQRQPWLRFSVFSGLFDNNNTNNTNNNCNIHKEGDLDNIKQILVELSNRTRLIS